MMRELIELFYWIVFLVLVFGAPVLLVASLLASIKTCDCAEREGEDKS